MKPADIYSLEPQFRSHDLDCVLNGWHHLVYEVELHLMDYVKMDAQTRIEERVYFNPYIDGHRVFTVGALFFDGEPVMIFRYAGRSGNDAKDRFVTNADLYAKMVVFMQSLYKTQLEEEDVIDPRVDVQALDYFYSTKMSLDMFQGK